MCILLCFAHLVAIDKVFSFLSKDEVEKLKQEEEKKIATLQRGGSGKKNKEATADLVDAANQVTPSYKDDELDTEDQDDDDDEDEEDEDSDDTDEDDDDDEEDDDEDADDNSRSSR